MNHNLKKTGEERRTDSRSVCVYFTHTFSFLLSAIVLVRLVQKTLTNTVLDSADHEGRIRVS